LSRALTAPARQEPAGFADRKSVAYEFANDDFQLAVFDTQFATGLPAPLGIAIKTNPELFEELAFAPAGAPAPVYMSMWAPLIRPPMSCATAIEETVLHALAAGTFSKVTVPVGIEVGSVAIEAFGVSTI
jgi:hypothetical protein